MNIERLNSIYKDIRLADKSDIDNIKQLTVDFPFYSLPYVILSKYYYQTEHYKFEDMLRQAAMRVKDRKVLYNYIHETDTEVPVKIETKTEIVEEKLSSVEDFLSDMELETSQAEDIAVIHEQAPVPIEKEEFLESSGLVTEEFLTEPAQSEPLVTDESNEFTLHGQSEELVIPEEESKTFDPIGEEIETEFSFSHAFSINKEIEVEEIAEPIETEEKEEIKTEQQEMAPDLETEKQEAEKEEETLGEELRQIVDDNLRKYPIYSLETHFKESEEIEEKDLAVEDEDDPGKDFFAWLNSPKNKQKQVVLVDEVQEIEEEEFTVSDKRINTNVNLDLIEKFIQSNPQITRQKKEFFNAENMAKKSEVNDLEIVTETLANIYLEQGNYDLAIKAYEKLSLQNPSKQTYFADLIEKINKERK
ncbi:MAG TPA: tetratricopeptide repeat protein [Bacteroidia bacterium]